MRAEDRVRLQHMIDAAEAAIRFVKGRQRADLDRDQMLLFALIRAVEVLGEASAKLSDDTRALDSTIPWGAIVSMRNRLIHGYFDIDADIVWKTVAIELPALLPQLRNLLARS
jgi:uncharacterized protein with HEPN domain